MDVTMNVEENKKGTQTKENEASKNRTKSENTKRIKSNDKNLKKSALRDQIKTANISPKRTFKVHFNTDSEIRHSLWLLLIYIVYLVNTLIFAGSIRSAHLYYGYNITAKFLVHAFTKVGKRNTLAFEEVSTISEIHDYILFNFLATYHGDDDFIDAKNSPQYFLENNLVLGTPRLRQIRVKEKPCTHKFKYDSIKTFKCYPEYSYAAEDTDNYKNFKYYTSAELHSSRVSGVVHTYYGGGYVQEFASSWSENKALLTELQASEWIDYGSRCVIIELNTFSESLSAFRVTKLIFEILPAGQVIPSFEIRSIQENRLVTNPRNYMFYIALIFYSIIVYYTYIEIRELKSLGFKQHFKNLLNWCDIFILLLAYSVIFYNIFHMMEVLRLGEKFLNNKENYLNLDNLLTGWNVYINIMACLAYLSCLKILDFFTFFKTMTQIIYAFRLCAKELLSFCLIFLLIVVSFAQMGRIVFGGDVIYYSTAITSLSTVLRVLMSGLEFSQIYHAQPIIALFFYIMLILFVKFISLNVFLAIILSAYSEVKYSVKDKESIVFHRMMHVIKKCLHSICSCRKRKWSDPAEEAKLDNKNDVVEEIEKEVIEELKEKAEENQNEDVDEYRNLLARLQKRANQLEIVLEQIVESLDDIGKLQQTNIGTNMWKRF